MKRGQYDAASGLYRATPRHRWRYMGGRFFRVINLGWWWGIVRIERKGQLPV